MAHMGSMKLWPEPPGNGALDYACGASKKANAGQRANTLPLLSGV